VKAPKRPFYCQLFVNSSGVMTIGAGVNISLRLGVFHFGGTISAGLAIAGNWDVAVFGTVPNVNLTTAGTGANVGVVLSASRNARSLQDIRGFFSEVTGQVGGLAVSHFRGNNSGYRVTGWQAFVGEGSGASVSADGTSTSISSAINLLRSVGC
jgi:hypothetical protein